MNIQKYGNINIWQYGNMEYRNWEIWKFGNREIGKIGNREIGNQGNTEIWKIWRSFIFYLDQREPHSIRDPSCSVHADTDLVSSQKTPDNRISIRFGNYV